ncbi:odorant receptor Or2-like [Malaya genurostris]|uniref:odorant receptor Or2-like n=1 Tax=Malaya genurostris TaxID=325434 RepID=UPI0026F3BF82|nr:odorant receptor Or2-like [Malaya genurostris]
MLMENCPIININIRIWLFWGYLRQTKWFSYLFGCIPVAILNVFQFMNVLKMAFSGEGDIDSITKDGFFTVLYFNLVLRTGCLVINRRKFERFFEGISAEYEQLEKHSNIRSILDARTRQARVLSKTNLYLGALMTTCFSLYPLFSAERVLPYGVFIPGIDVHATPIYEIVFFLEFYLTIPACCMYIPFTSFYCTCSQFGLVRIAALKQSLQKLHQHNWSEQALIAKLKQCLEYHKEIIKYVSDLNELIAYIFLLELLICGTMLCALLFILNLSNQLTQIAMICSYLLTLLLQLFALYWHSNEIREQSLEIGDWLYYNSAWLDFSVPVKKMILLMIARTQRPLVIKNGNVYPMTLETFQSLLNTSYSYYTILRRVYK